MTAYSFKDVTAYISGPGGDINIGYGAGVGDEGVSVDRNEDKNTMVTGADGSGMHSLHAASPGTLSVRLLKTSATNGLLMDMYNYQTGSGSLHGQNTVVIRDASRGDTITCSQVAFKRAPANRYGKTGDILEWQFDCVSVEGVLAGLDA